MSDAGLLIAAMIGERPGLGQLLREHLTVRAVKIAFHERRSSHKPGLDSFVRIAANHQPHAPH